MVSDYVLDNDYEVEAELGHGAFSIVKEVHLKGQRDATAVKITPLATLQQFFGYDRARLIERLIRFRHINHNMRTKNCIRYIDFRMSSEDLFGFFEICRGGDLFSRIVDHPSGIGHLPEESARKVAYNLITCMAELHGEGIIHRDIKPENILYRTPDAPDDEVVLSDFGCALESMGGKFVKRVDNANGWPLPGYIAGSPGYMAPEMGKGLPYNSQVDIFALGVVLYEALTGRSPFVSQNAEDLVKETVERAVPYPRQYWHNISFEARDMVACMLEKAPEARWTAVELLSHPWLNEMKCAADSASEVGPETIERVTQSLQRLDTAKSMDSSDADADASERMAPRLTALSSRRETRVRPPSTEQDCFDTGKLLNGQEISKNASLRFEKLAR